VKNSIRAGGVALIVILQGCDDSGLADAEHRGGAPALQPAAFGFRTDVQDPVLPLALGGPAAAGNLVFSGVAASDYAGASVSDVGDFDGDGNPDFLVGAHGAGNGTAYLIRGGPWLTSLTGPVDLAAQANNNITVRRWRRGAGHWSGLRGLRRRRPDCGVHPGCRRRGVGVRVHGHWRGGGRRFRPRCGGRW
jgi:hypothetical protein